MRATATCCPPWRTHSARNTPEAQDSLGRKRWLPEKRLLKDKQYYLPYLAFRTPGEWFDTLGHLLAILSGLRTKTARRKPSTSSQSIVWRNIRPKRSTPRSNRRP
jgi:hypothetical protein